MFWFAPFKKEIAQKLIVNSKGPVFKMNFQNYRSCVNKSKDKTEQFLFLLLLTLNVHDFLRKA